MYLKSPDDMKLEFTVDAPGIEEIAAMRRKDAPHGLELARWMRPATVTPITATGRTENL